MSDARCVWCERLIGEHTLAEAHGCLAAISLEVVGDEYLEDEAWGWRSTERVDGPTYRQVF